MAVAPGAFADTLQAHIGRWLAVAPETPVLMAGMVGSRNGWAEAAYAALPCGAGDLARALLPVVRADGGRAEIVPGVAGPAPSGLPDVMRGEETLAIGAGRSDGFLCLPGTHSKWIEMRAGRIVAFASFMTGESFGLYRQHSIIGRLAEAPAEPMGLEAGAEAALARGGLTHALFSARTRVLAGAMSGRAVESYLSALLIRAEIEGAIGLFPDLPAWGQIGLIAEGTVAAIYEELLAGAGIGVEIIAPETALLAGLSAILKARGDAA
jgi:2-dehydro-3-deoxygalactonokinase